MKKWDLPFYYFLQEPFVRFARYDQLGDLTGYGRFRQKINDDHDREEFYLAGLGAWQMADTLRPLYRVLKYLEEGEAPANPYSPGNWTLKTTGYLSTQGPLYGLRSYLFLQGNSPHPAFLSLELWASPISDQNQHHPFGMNIQIHRLPLTGLTVGSYTVSIGQQLGFSYQDSYPWEIHPVRKGGDRVLFHGGATVFLHSESTEFRTSFTCREPQMIWRESFDTGCSGYLGILKTL